MDDTVAVPILNPPANVDVVNTEFSASAAPCTTDSVGLYAHPEKLILPK
jgi:hypothetical protein